MRSKTFLLSLLLICVASLAAAQHHGRAVAPPQSPDAQMLGPQAATVSGTVSSVNGNLIALANGLVTIDATNAKIVGDRGASASVATIAPGALITAVLASGTAAANAPLPATLIAVAHLPQVSLTGTVTSVDPDHSTLTLLGRTIQVNADTRFVGPFHGSTTNGLADVLPNQIVSIDANANGSSLVATSVLVVAVVQQNIVIYHGTVKSIAADSWVISLRDKDVTVAVNAQTKIVGDPKVGDTVDAVTRLDTNGAYVALAIMKAIAMGGMH